jgi:hypothetical protein
MARKTKPAESAESGVQNDSVQDAAHDAANAAIENAAADGEGTPETEEPQLPPVSRFNGVALEHVACAATTITGCSENELKNFLATADYVSRNITLHLANNWKKICRTAKLQADEGKSPKVPLAVSIVINHENLLLMDTSLKTSFALKYTEQSETQEDLRQVLFVLPTEAAPDGGEEPGSRSE